ILESPRGGFPVTHLAILAVAQSMGGSIMMARSPIMEHGTLGERLIEEGQISSEDLLHATRLHPALRVKLGQGLLDLNVVRDEQLDDSSEEVTGPEAVLPRGDRHLPDLDRVMPEHIQRRLGIVPLFDTADALVVVTDDLQNQAAIRETAERVGRPISALECESADLDGLLEALNGAEYLRRSTSELRDRMPEQSAFEVLTKAQGKALWTVLVEAKLPIYTILVPLYREAAVLPTMLQGLARLDYPADKLDVQLLLEADDVETLAAVAAAQLPPTVR